jgi:hypothetical protein
MLRKAWEGKTILPPAPPPTASGSQDTIDNIDWFFPNSRNPDKSAVSGYRHTLDDPSITIDEDDNKPQEEKGAPPAIDAIDSIYRPSLDSRIAIDKADSIDPEQTIDSKREVEIYYDWNPEEGDNYSIVPLCDECVANRGSRDP